MPGAVAPIRPLAWELKYAESVALKKQKKKRERERKVSQTKFSRINHQKTANCYLFVYK